ncbi:UNVERIFIED_CONTAM: hypothetical protein HDU68_004545 [Siphonaria sp. JEL0065]|nr:hypothetical protein HDU68_004545 [Siphonaria sp. JEL0065]
MGGEEAVTKLRGMGVSTPIIAVSAQSISSDFAIQLQTSGFSQIIAKPVSRDVVLGILMRFNSLSRPLQRKSTTARSDAATIREKEDSPPIFMSRHSVVAANYLLSNTGEEGRLRAIRRGSTLSEDVITSSRMGSMQRRISKKDSSGKLSVLVVDDSLINRAILTKILESSGLFDEVTEVSNGAEAVRVCTQKRFCLIFMDLEMPIMSGEEATARIRALEIFTPIVAVTGNTMKADDIHPLWQAGMNEIIKKPVEKLKVLELCNLFLQLNVVSKQ